VSRAREWNDAVIGYLSKRDQFGNEVMHDALQSTLNRLYVDPQHAGKSNEELLETAGSKVLAAMGIKEKPPAADPKGARALDPAVAAAARVAKAAAAAANTIPQTLGDLPPADGEHIGDNEFGVLDKLTGMEAEEALLSMTAAQQSRYGDTRRLHG
jgi:hypothetical protein